MYNVLAYPTIRIQFGWYMYDVITYFQFTKTRWHCMTQQKHILMQAKHKNKKKAKANDRKIQMNKYKPAPTTRTHTHRWSPG